MGMREFKTLVKDTKTGMQLILSECSYNSAVWWLECKGFTEYVEFDTNGSEVWLRFDKPYKRLFIYDEERGYLLGN